jgi:hypothetical protein
MGAEISEIMKIELKNHLEEFRRSEQLGESRLNIYLTIVTVILGGSGYLFYTSTKGGLDLQNLHPEDLWLLFFALLATLMFGILTLLRMVHRNLVSSQELRAANRIRWYFFEKEQDILKKKYLEYWPCDDLPVREWKWKNGGLVENVVLINAFLAAIILVVFAEIKSPHLDIPCSILVGLLGFLAASYGQYYFATKEYHNEEDEIGERSICPTKELEELLAG